MKIHILFGALLWGLTLPVSGQQVARGTVTDGSSPLQAATVYWANTTYGTLTGEDGSYSLPTRPGSDLLVASLIGFAPDTIRFTGEPIVFHLKTQHLTTEEVTVATRLRGTYVSPVGAGKMETISFTGLTKMACCNLAESFENSASVTVGYSDAVSGARQIKMLGLTGNYAQLLDESRPVMRGLSTPYGLNYTPGMWLKSIQISKGTSSVAHGHEAITGQINLEYRKPTDEEPLFINGYFDQQLRTELNLASSLQINDRLSTVLLAHGSMDRREEDHNHDGFLDTPLTQQINFANRWLYAVPMGVQLRAGIKYVGERREGGQKAFRSGEHRGGTEVYGSQIDNEYFNGYLKAALPLGRRVFDPSSGEESQSNLAVVADYSHYNQHSFFGLKAYDGVQNSVYTNLLYNLYLSKIHSFTFGLSATLDHYNETLLDRFTDGADANGVYTVYSTFHDLGRKESEAGAFAEYNLKLDDRFNFIAGLRGDYHNLYNFIVTPRAHLRWQIAKPLTLRGSVGLGSRSANLITDNIGMLATGRRILFDTDLRRLEKSLTAGGSLVYTFRLGADPGASLSFDYFHTGFSRRVIADQEYGTDVVYLYNVGGRPWTDTWQVDFNWTPFTGFDVFAAFRYTATGIKLDRPDSSRETTSLPLMDKFKTLINLQYATRYRKWVFDFTAQVNGQSRLPGQDGTVGGEHSPVYPMFFAQVSRKFRMFDVYVGCENIGNYRQKNPVLSPDTPFESSFNSSVVWGPLMGRKIYAGFRFNL